MVLCSVKRTFLRNTGGAGAGVFIGKMDVHTQTKSVYVSITGLQLKSWRLALRFAWHALRAMGQARRAPGNILAEAKTIDGVHHTRTVWESEADMRRFLYRGAHRAAIRAFPDIASGKTFGYAADDVPDWDEVHALWLERGRDYAAQENALK